MFALQIARWQQEGHNQLDVIVEDPAHLPAAQALFAELYGVQDALSDIPQHLLAISLQLADQLQLPEIVKAVQQRFTADRKFSYAQETLSVLFSLPSSCWHREAFLPLLPGAVAAALCDRDRESAEKLGVQHMLMDVWGDLEDVFSASSVARRDMFCKLPLPAVAILVSSEQLAVASEDTVLHALKQWVNTPKSDWGFGDDHTTRFKQMQSLVRCVRFPQLSPAYLACVAPQITWLLGNINSCRLEDDDGNAIPFVSKRDMMAAALVQQRQLTASKLDLGLPANWYLGPRAGVSAVRSITMTNSISSDTLRTRVVAAIDYAQCVTPGLAVETVVLGTSGLFVGCKWQLLLVCTAVAIRPLPSTGPGVYTEQYCGVKVGLFVKPSTGYHDKRPCWDPMNLTFKHGGLVQKSVNVQGLVCGNGQGLDDFWGLGVLENWDVAAWAAKGVHAEGSVTIEWTVAPCATS